MSTHSSHTQESYEAALQELLASGQLVDMAASTVAGNRTSLPDSPPSISEDEVSVAAPRPDKPTSLLCNPFAWKVVLLALMLGTGFLALQLVANPVFVNLALAHLPTASPSKPERIDLQDAVDTARAFLAANSVEDQLNLVRHPDVVKEKMLEWQEHRTPWRIRVEDLTFGHPIRAVREGLDYYLIEAKDATSDVPLPIYLEHHEGTFKVDWAATVSYQEMPWNVFVRTKPIDAQRARVVIERTTVYLGDHSPSRHTAYRISHPDTLAEFYAYVPRYSTVATALEDLLRDDEVTGAILDLVYAERTEGANLVTIHQVIQRGWIVNYTQANHDTI